MVNADEEWQLEAFLERAERMRRLPILVGGGLSTSWSVTFNQTSGVRFSATEPDEESFRSLLVDLRPFTMQKEPVFLNRVHNLLEQTLTDAGLRETLHETRDEWKRAQRGAINVAMNADTYDAATVFNLWLNGYYFHDDRAKSDALKTFPPILASLSRNLMFSLTTDAVRAVIRTAWVIANANVRGGYT
jgi:hypothetical protein